MRRIPWASTSSPTGLCATDHERPVRRPFERLDRLVAVAPRGALALAERAPDRHLVAVAKNRPSQYTLSRAPDPPLLEPAGQLLGPRGGGGARGRLDLPE